MDCILFSAKKKFYLEAEKLWDGTIEYSYDNIKWQEWNGEEIGNNVIYMRGINNTRISATDFGGYYSWEIKGKNVKCQGNIENLLDYKSVINNIHPQMKSYCFFICLKIVKHYKNFH